MLVNRTSFKMYGVFSSKYLTNFGVAIEFKSTFVGVDSKRLLDYLLVSPT